MEALAAMAAAAFVAATLVPAQSEAVFVGLLAARAADPPAPFRPPSAAHTAGAVGLLGQSGRLSLAFQELLTLEPTSSGLEVCSPTGRLWLTQEGDGMDHILEPGEEFRTTHPGRVVVAG